MKLKNICIVGLSILSLSVSSCSKASGSSTPNNAGPAGPGGGSQTDPTDPAAAQKKIFDCLNTNTNFKANMSTMTVDDAVQKFAVAAKTCSATPEDVYTFTSYVELGKY